MLAPDDRRVRVVANPAAAGGRARRWVPRLRRALDDEGVAYHVRWTGAAGSAAELAGEAVEGGATHVVAVGGDGTVSGCAGALAGAEAALAVAPQGTGNDFARAVGASPDPSDVAAAAARGASRPVDLGRVRRVEGGGGAGEGGAARFVNGLGVGLDGAVARRVAGSARLEGKLGYVLAAVREAWTFEAFELALETPAGRLEGATLLAGVSNGPAVGGGFRVAEGAEVDDGALDVYRFGNAGRLRRLRELPRVRAGGHLDLDVFHRELAGEARLELEETVPAHLDGEPARLGPGAYEVQVEAGALSLATPPAA